MWPGGALGKVESPRKTTHGPELNAELRRRIAQAVHIIHYNRYSHYYPPAWCYCDANATGSGQTLFCWESPGKTRLMVRLPTFTALVLSG